MTKVRYFLKLHFQFLGPKDAHRVKTRVDQYFWQVSRSCSTCKCYKFELSKNNVLSSLRPMDENSRRHEQVFRSQKELIYFGQKYSKMTNVGCFVGIFGEA